MTDNANQQPIFPKKTSEQQEIDQRNQSNTKKMKYEKPIVIDVDLRFLSLELKLLN